MKSTRRPASSVSHTAYSRRSPRVGKSVPAVPAARENPDAAHVVKASLAVVPATKAKHKPVIYGKR